jgi:hypothetical protein
MSILWWDCLNNPNIHKLLDGFDSKNHTIVLSAAHNLCEHSQNCISDFVERRKVSVYFVDTDHSKLVGSLKQCELKAY